MQHAARDMTCNMQLPSPPSHLYARKPLDMLHLSCLNHVSSLYPCLLSPGSSLLPLSYFSVVALGYWSSVVGCCVAPVTAPVLLSYCSSDVFLCDRSDEAHACADSPAIFLSYTFSLSAFECLYGSAGACSARIRCMHACIPATLDASK